MIGGCHVHRIDPATLAVDRAVSDMTQPNGLAFSPDENLHYISTNGCTLG
jgi:gluconolactonase